MSYIDLELSYPTLSQYAVFGAQDLSANDGVGPISVNVISGYYGYQDLVNGSVDGPWNPTSGLNLDPTDLTNASSELFQLLQVFNDIRNGLTSINVANAVTSQTSGRVTFSANTYYYDSTYSPLPITYGNSSNSVELYFDAAGNPNAQFFLDSSYNIQLNNCTFTLANGAQAKNIFISSWANIILDYNNNLVIPETSLTIPVNFITNLGNINFFVGIPLTLNLEGKLYQLGPIGSIPPPGSYHIQFYGSTSTINITLPAPGPGPGPEPSPTPISNICFAGNTPIVTDQGSVLIKNIKPSVHTIHNEAVVAITKNVTLDKYLVCFEKDSLGEGIPSEKTIMSKDHKVLYMGELIKAYRFIEMFENVKKVKYNGEILYNIVMKNYRKVSVNNMVCETLHPKNIIAKLYTSMFYENKINAIEELNGCILANDRVGYSKVVKRIGK
jgi:hypothetical protein